MTELRLARHAVEDLERLAAFLVEAGDPDAAAITDVILDGLMVLARHPLVGRPTPPRFRELVISRGKSGYVALYLFDEVADVVTVLAVRHQREAGFG